MKVVIDNKIPYIENAIAEIADEVVYLSGSEFTAEAIRDADALIIRTRTRCNRRLLEGSSVRFIATATIGFDHIDTEYCKEAGIVWTNCPGCNAGSVAQYMYSTLLLLQKQRGLVLNRACMGIVGVGHVGSLVKQVAESLGMKVVCCDPPRADRGESGFLPLQELVGACDVITFHTPLIREGKYSTFHMADEAFFSSLKPGVIIINTSRGEVIETKALLDALDNGIVGDAVIDVWEHEPDIDINLLTRVFLGTPHIAGYSADGKANATRMSLEALCRFFNITDKKFTITPPTLSIDIDLNDPVGARLQMYNPQKDSDALKKSPELFEAFRSNYPLRREFYE